MCEAVFKTDLITLYCGDSLTLLNELQFTAFVSDPPYGVNFAGKATKHTKANGGYNENDSDIGVEVVKKCLLQADRGAFFTGNRLLQK